MCNQYNSTNYLNSYVNVLTKKITDGSMLLDSSCRAYHDSNKYLDGVAVTHESNLHGNIDNNILYLHNHYKNSNIAKSFLIYMSKLAKKTFSTTLFVYIINSVFTSLDNIQSKASSSIDYIYTYNKGIINFLSKIKTKLPLAQVIFDITELSFWYMFVVPSFVLIMMITFISYGLLLILFNSFTKLSLLI